MVPPRQREMEWLSRNSVAVAQYAGEWVAIQDDRIVAHGTDLDSVLKTARRAGCVDPLVFEAWSQDEGEWLL